LGTLTTPDNVIVTHDHWDKSNPGAKESIDMLHAMAALDVETVGTPTNAWVTAYFDERNSTTGVLRLVGNSQVAILGGGSVPEIASTPKPRECDILSGLSLTQKE
jgi:hypothetical protein